MPESFALTGPVAEELLSERDPMVLASFSRSFYLAPRRETMPGLNSLLLHRGTRAGTAFSLLATVVNKYVFRPRELLSAIQITCCIGTSPGYVCRQGGTGRLRYVLPFLSRTEIGVALCLATEVVRSFSCDLRGLNRLLPELLASGKLPLHMAEDAVGMDASERGLLSIGGPLLHKAQEWIRGADFSPSLFVSGLMGLGPGLTPSGDDILGGILIALHCLGRLDQAGILWDAIGREAHRTNRISQAHLYAAAHGMGAEVLHGWIHALQGEADRQMLYGLCERLGRVGHSIRLGRCVRGVSGPSPERQTLRTMVLERWIQFETILNWK